MVVVAAVVVLSLVVVGLVAMDGDDVGARLVVVVVDVDNDCDDDDGGGPIFERWFKLVAFEMICLESGNGVVGGVVVVVVVLIGLVVLSVL